MADIEARVAVLEQIAKITRDALVDIRSEIRAIRSDIGDVRKDARSDYRWLLGVTLGGFAGLLGVVAHGFRWL